MDPVTTGEYSWLKKKHETLQKQWQEEKLKKQEISRNLKLTTASLLEYQTEYELLEEKAHAQLSVYEKKFQCIQENENSAIHTHQEIVKALQEEISEAKMHQEALLEQLDAQKTEDLSSHLNDTDNTELELFAEHEHLTETHTQLLEDIQSLETDVMSLQATLQTLNPNLAEIQASLDIKTRELSEKRDQYTKLEEELFEATTLLSTYRVDECKEEDKNSLFAEVDTKRVHIQGTLNSMKDDYVRMKNKRSELEKCINDLKKRFIRFKELQKSDALESENDFGGIVTTLKNQQKVLQHLINKYKRLLKQQPLSSLCTSSSYQELSRRFEDIEKDQENQIKDLNMKMSGWYTTKTLYSSSLARLKIDLLYANSDIEKLHENLNVLHESVGAESNKDSVCKNDSFATSVEEIDEGLINKGILKSVENVRIEDEKVPVVVEAAARKGVKFAEEVNDEPESKPQIRSRGKRVYVMKKRV